MGRFSKGGYVERVLKVDLTRRETEVVSLDEALIEKYMGGEGLASRLLYDMVPPETDALGPENPILIFTGPLTGTRAPGGNLTAVVSVSPVTGGIGGSESQGFFGAELKLAGYDGIIVTGSSEAPVLLVVTGEKVEIRGADDLWGLDTYETEEAVIKVMGDPRIRVMRIGQAGENLSSMACVVFDNGNVAGRFGLGAVMGSKKLKGIAVRGKGKVPLFCEEEFGKVRKEWSKMVSDFMFNEILTPYSTAGFLPYFAGLGDSPVKNWQEAPESWEGLNRLTGQYMHETMEMKDFVSCHSCPLGGHRKRVTIKEGPFSGSYFTEPEYETIQALAANSLNSDPAFAVKAGDVCNRYGLDSISTGSVIAFAIECFEKGLITREDTDGIELRFGDGNSKAILEMIDKIARGEGFGKVLMNDVKKASEIIGKGSEDFAMHSGNMSMYMHDPRAGFGAGLGFAVSNVSGDGSAVVGLEWGGIDPELGFPSPLDRHSADRRALATIKEQDKQLVFDSIGLCHFICTGVPFVLVLKEFWMATGWDINIFEAMTIGERIANIRRAFNVRQGISKGDDRLPKRLLNEPLSSGEAGGQVVPLEEMLEEYYQLRGWDRESGRPLESTLKRLGLDDVSDDLW